ncbi:nitrilase-related carbon-nitrogen hydrolase, partial [Hydrocarboniphaga effusa]
MADDPAPTEFLSLYRRGFARVAACTFEVALADPQANAESIARLAARAGEQGAALLVFPELALSAYSIDDLLLQDALLDAVETQVERLVAYSADWLPL